MMATPTQPAPPFNYNGQGEPDYARTHAGDTTPNTHLPYYIPDVRSKLSPQLRSLLETYSGIPSADIPDHCQRIRDEAWSIRAYPCIGLGVFLNRPLMPQHPFYPSLLKILNDDPTALFIDIGVFLGIDLRFLWRDLTTSSPSPPHKRSPFLLAPKIIAIDLIEPFWPLSHTFFHDDPSTFPVRFIHADALSPSSAPTLSPLARKVSVLNISQVLHQFTYAGQLAACKTLCEHYSHPPTSSPTSSSSQSQAANGTVVMGNQIGSRHGRIAHIGSAQIETWHHSPASWRQMWEAVGTETDTKWETQTVLLGWGEVGFDSEKMEWLGDDAGILIFTCRRVA